MNLFERICCWLGAQVVWDVYIQSPNTRYWYVYKEGVTTKAAALNYCNDLRTLLPGWMGYRVAACITWKRRPSK